MLLQPWFREESKIFVVFTWLFHPYVSASLARIQSQNSSSEPGADFAFFRRRLIFKKKNSKILSTFFFRSNKLIFWVLINQHFDKN